jgi:hypothetical protein
VPKLGKDFRNLTRSKVKEPITKSSQDWSGHGFKHLAAVGEVLAELATDGKSTLDISSFSLDRFALSTR